MAFSVSDIRRLEELARLELEPEERERLGLQLARIVEFVRVLQGAQLPRASGDAGRAGGTSPAEDEIGECLEREEVLRAAPESEDGCFVVPPVIETEES
jgi:aspartyl-tRNA(Asn)/glutamyl-tRNA(Gln) amidotransferase subunit C